MRRLASAVLACLAGLSVLGSDIAQAQSCRRLQSELAHLRDSGGGGTSRDRARYERAYREQANVLARTEARARNAGCFGGAFMFFRREAERSCRTLVPKMRDMQANLGRLDRLRRQGGGGGGGARRIRQLQRAIAARGCGLPREDETEQAARPRAAEPSAPRPARGTFRTLCVRTCDGYYFPISFSTTQDQFGADAQTCSAMCPGTEARLFYHPNPGGSPADMVSMEGATYTSLPTAFQYRTSIDQSCTCKPAGGYALTPIDANARPSVDTAAPADPTALLPRPRPAPGEDPETLANRLGGFDPRAGSTAATASVVATTADGRPVRVVGPTYLGAPEQDGVVVTPVPN